MFDKAVAGRSSWSACGKSLRNAAVLLTLCSGVALAGEAAPAAGAIAQSAFWSWVIAPMGAIVGLFFAFVFFRQVLKVDEGTEKMRAIAGYVREGANAYLKRQYRVIAIVVVCLFVLFAGIAVLGKMRPLSPIMFVFGAFFSGLTGWIGMRAATHSSARDAASERS